MRPVSKAFTKDDDGSGFTHPTVPSRGHAGPVTALGARLARARLAEVTAQLERSSRSDERASLELAVARAASVAAAPVGNAPAHDDVVAFGAQVRLRDPAGKERVVVVASADEIGLVPHAASVTSPIARGLLGAHPGDVVEVDGPRGLEELTVLEVRFPS